MYAMHLSIDKACLATTIHHTPYIIDDNAAGRQADEQNSRAQLSFLYFPCCVHAPAQFHIRGSRLPDRHRPYSYHTTTILTD